MSETYFVESTMEPSDLKREKKSIIAGQAQQPSVVLEMCRRYLERQPDDGDIWKIRINAAKKLGLFQEALLGVKKIIELGESSPQAVMHWLVMARNAGNLVEAKKAAREAESVVKDPGLLEVVATNAVQIDENQIANRILERLVAEHPEHSSLWDLCGVTRQHLGDLAGAQECFLRAIEIDEDNSHAYFMLSFVSKQTRENNHLELLNRKMEQLGEVKRGEDKKRYQHFELLAYALAKEYEDVGNYDASFDWYMKGARAVRAMGNYEPETDGKLIDALTYIAGLEGRDGEPRPLKPIFVLGMPRTGSTLLERILSSHSQVSSLGETGVLFKMFAQQLQIRDPNPLHFAEEAGSLTRFDFKALGDKYLEYTHEDPGKAGYFIEKLPQNMYYAGILLRAFPDCKILYTDRSPIDSCLSNLKQLFAPGAWPYSYDLFEIADQYLLANRSIDYWMEKYPDRAMKVVYEDLVTEPAGSIRNVLAFCGLDEEEACFSPEKNTRATATASFAQVREPINRNALHKWKKFEGHFEELREYFESRGVSVE